MNQGYHYEKKRTSKEKVKKGRKEYKRVQFLDELQNPEIKISSDESTEIKNSTMHQQPNSGINANQHLILKNCESSETSYLTVLSQDKSNEESFTSANCYSQEVKESSFDEQLAQLHLEEIRQSSWSQQMRLCGPTNIKIGCLESCTNWTLNLFYMDKGCKNSGFKKLMKIPASQVIKSISPYKSNDDPNNIFKTSDLIEQMVLSEDIERAFKQDPTNLVEDYNLALINENNGGGQQCNQSSPGGKSNTSEQHQMIGSQTHSCFHHSTQSDFKIQHEQLPIQPSYSKYHHNQQRNSISPPQSSRSQSNHPFLASPRPVKPSVTLNKVPSADSLICLEFKIIKDPQDKLSPLRLVDDYFPNSEFLFEIAGYIHGKKVFSEPIEFQVVGRKIIKSIEDRIKEFQETQYQVGWTHEVKKNGYLNFIVPFQGEERVAFEFYSPKLYIYFQYHHYFYRQKLQDFQPQLKRIVQSKSQLKRIFFQLSFNFNKQGSQQNSPLPRLTEHQFIGLDYIFKDLLQKRKEERERMKKKRQMILRGIDVRDHQELSGGSSQGTTSTRQSTISSNTSNKPRISSEKLNQLIQMRQDPQRAQQANGSQYNKNSTNESAKLKLYTFLEQTLNFSIDSSYTIQDLIDVISELTIFGKRFIFSEEINEESDILLYIPMISALSLEFKNYKNKIRLEIPLISSQSQTLPIELITSKISSEILKQKLTELEFEKSFFVINWMYIMNLKSKIQHLKLPNFLIYYKLSEASIIDPKSLQLRVIGVQCDSQTQLKTWLKDEEEGQDIHRRVYQESNSYQRNKSMEKYYMLNQRLKEFVDLDKEVQSRRDLKLRKYPHSNEMVGEIFHIDYFEYMGSFFDDKDLV